MKKRWFFIAILIISFSLNASAWFSVNPSSSTPSSQTIEGNLFAFSLPNLTINAPKNATYLNNYSIPLNYSVSTADSVWYSLDSGANITLALGLKLNLSTSSTFFANSTGSHFIYMYANNSAGETSQNVSFYVNLTLFNIIHNEWKGVQKGNSTNFTILSYGEIQNLSNIILENTNYGKINFNENINLTQDDDFGDNQVDLDSNVNISFNRIEINSTALPNFNKSATLSLYVLTFSNPRILRDGVLCPSDICIGKNYSGGVLSFNVTGFAVYSAEETPTEVPPVVTPPSGGGGGGGAITIKGFSISPDEIKVKLKQGTFLTENLIITNNENKVLDFELEVSKVKDFVVLSEYKFRLSPKESKLITLNILANKDAVPDLYIGEILIKAGGQEKNILTAIEIESAQPLFDVKAKIPLRYNYVMPDEELISEIEIYNLGEIEKEVDILVEYKILDWQGNIIVQEHEQLAVNTKISYLKTFKIPTEALFGRYVLYVKTNYKEKVASASVWFNVGKPPSIPLDIALIVLAITAIITAIIIFLWSRKIKKQEKSYKKIDEKTLRRVIIKRGK